VAEPLLAITALDKRFGGLAVADGITLDVLAGELHAVIGPNGAGKTSLVNLIAGVLAPDGGEIHFAGQDITRLSVPARARLGLSRSFQITALVPSFSVRENVALAAQRHGGNGVDDALEQVGLSSRAALRAENLSHGEKRALELAMALAQRPKLLLLDEPLAGAGPEESARIVALLRALKGQYPMLLIEHDMDAVFALADRISVLVQGRVVASGAPEKIRADHAVREAYLGEEG
jgi:branched-chain amino acid transport system ATP-binding protein